MKGVDYTNPKQLRKPPRLRIYIDEYWVHSIFEGAVSDSEINRFIVWLSDNESEAYPELDKCLKRVYQQYTKIAKQEG